MTGASRHSRWDYDFNKARNIYSTGLAKGSGGCRVSPTDTSTLHGAPATNTITIPVIEVTNSQNASPKDLVGHIRLNTTLQPTITGSEDRAYVQQSATHYARLLAFLANPTDESWHLVKLSVGGRTEPIGERSTNNPFFSHV